MPASIRPPMDATSPVGGRQDCASATEPEETPRNNQRRETSTRAQTELREAIGDAMNRETVYCTVDEFRNHYLPFSVKRTHIARVKKEAKLFDPDNPPSTSGQTEAGCYRQQLTSIFDAIRKLTMRGRKHNGYLFELVPNNPIRSRMVGSNHRTDAVLRAGEGNPLNATDIVVAMELKKKRDFDHVRLNQLQLAGVCVSIMNDDARRAFTYGITIEDHRMSLWYFSRSHSVKSQSFDFSKKPDILIAVLISFMFATPEELGFSPFVTRNHDGTYIYKLETDEQTRYYKATHSFEDYRNLSVARRSTRILQVTEVVSETDHTPTEIPERPKVLKDVWIQEGSPTEAEIQQALFKDIDAFAAGDWKKHPCLKDFLDDEDGQIFLAQLEQLLEDQKYQDLFLIIKHVAKGEISKELTADARLSPRVFLPKSNATPAKDHFSIDTRITSKKDEVMTRNSAIRPPTEASAPYRRYAPKQRHFYIFDDFCTAVHYLPSVGDAFDVLAQCTTALRLMHCAGWVHRDISVGNILAIQDMNGQWQLKLADLEYAKRFPSHLGNSDPKTGTPFFMAVEILSQRYLIKRPEMQEQRFKFKKVAGADNSSEPINPVKHNFHHDLESLFWIVLWLITSRVGHTDSEVYAAPFFDDTMTLSPKRLDAFESDIQRDLTRHLHHDLSDLAQPVNEMRKTLVATTWQRALDKKWNELDTYSWSHLRTSLFFEGAGYSEETLPLRSVRLQPRNPNKPYPTPLDLEIPDEAEAPLAAVEEPNDPARVAPAPTRKDDRSGKTSNKRTRSEDDDSGREEGAKRSRANEGGRTFPGGFTAHLDPASPSPAPRPRGQTGTRSRTAGAGISGSTR